MAKRSLRIASLRYQYAVRRSGSIAFFVVIRDLIKIVNTLQSNPRTYAACSSDSGRIYRLLFHHFVFGRRATAAYKGELTYFATDDCIYGSVVLEGFC
jgi:hypothetical protein